MVFFIIKHLFETRLRVLFLAGREPGACSETPRGLSAVAILSRFHLGVNAVFSPATAYVFGALVIAVALLLTTLYFYPRRAIMREQTGAALLRDQKM
jgi:hypothetical protein